MVVCEHIIYGDPYKDYTTSTLNLILTLTKNLTSVADPDTLKGGGGVDNVSAPSSFTANAHNELYAFYTGKSDLLRKKILSQ